MKEMGVFEGDLGQALRAVRESEGSSEYERGGWDWTRERGWACEKGRENTF